MLLGLLILFLVVAAGGATLAFLEARGHVPPLPVSAIHGGTALVAIALLVLQDVAHPDNRLLNAATVVFMLTAAGGLLLFAFRATRQRLPLPVVALHAGFALTALVLMGAGWLRS
jgi:hypothetical protein